MRPVWGTGAQGTRRGGRLLVGQLVAERRRRCALGGLGLPTTQLPAGSCTRWAVSRDGIAAEIAAASASAGADLPARRARELPFCRIINASLRACAPESWYDRWAASVDNHSVMPRPTASEPITRTTNGILASRSAPQVYTGELEDRSPAQRQPIAFALAFTSPGPAPWPGSAVFGRAGWSTGRGIGRSAAWPRGPRFRCGSLALRSPRPLRGSRPGRRVSGGLATAVA